MKTVVPDSTSGYATPLGFNTSCAFSNHQVLASRSYCRLFKAQRYGRWYVLKGLNPDKMADPLYMAILEKEFNSSVVLDHPNIVNVYSNENDSLVGECIVMEYIEGRTLTQFLDEKHSCGLRKKIVMQLLDAMAYYHAKQIVHRDLKPSNILVTRNGDNVKIIDFGLADSDDYAVLKEPAYTQGYAAPEQMIQGATVDCRTDIYAFGVLLRRIFPHRYGHIARKCTRHNPEKRYSSADAVKRAIKRRRSILLSVVVLFLLIVVYLVCWGLQSAPSSISSPVIYNVQKNDLQPTTQRTDIPLDQQSTSVLKEGKIEVFNFQPQVSEMQRYADSLLTVFSLQITKDSNLDSYIVGQMSARNSLLMYIKQVKLMTGIKVKNEGEFNGCWYLLYEIISDADKKMKTAIDTRDWIESTEETRAELKRIADENEKLLNEVYMPLYKNMMIHKAEYYTQ